MDNKKIKHLNQYKFNKTMKNNLCFFTLLSSAACVATAADKAPKQTTPRKSKNTQRCVYLCRRSRLWRFGMLRS